MESFLRTLGIADNVLEHLDKAELAFQRPSILWIGLVALIPVGVFIYRRQNENLASIPKRFRVILSVTRITILAALVAVLAGPYLKIDHMVTKRPIVGVLLDASQSMRLPAAPYASDEARAELAVALGLAENPDGVTDEIAGETDALSREDLADRVLATTRPILWDKLAEDYEVRFYSFGRRSAAQLANNDGDDAVDDEGQETADPDSNSSYIGDAVLHALDDAAGQQVAGLYVLSDGQNTGGHSPAEAARLAAEAGVPIFVTALGSPTRLRDVSIVDVYTSGQVAVGDTVSVHVTLESQGFDGRSVEVQLKAGDEVLDTRPAVVRDSEHQHVELTFKAERAGARYLTVEVPALEEEAEQLRVNNTDTTFVRITKDKLRVLIIDGLPRWDFRFIKNAIRRDNGLAGQTAEQADVLLEAEWRRMSEAERSAARPDSVDRLKDYDTIIVGDVSPELMNAKFVETLVEAVTEHGVGLIVAAGPQHMPHRYDTAFHDLLPVEMQPKVAGIEAPVYKPHRLQVSPDGLVHESMRLYDDPGRNQSVWEGMPAFFWTAAVEQKKAGSVVLAWNPSIEGRRGKMPLIAHHYVGDGRVLFVGTDSTWLWRRNTGDRYFYKFWGQAVRFVAAREDGDKKSSWVEVRPRRAQPGEPMQVELMAYDADGQPLTNSTQTMTLLGPGWREDVELEADPGHAGRFTARVVPKEPGVHRWIYEPVDADEPIEAAVQVLSAPEEFRHPNLNLATLELLTSTTGGELLTVPEVPTVAEHLEGETEIQPLHREATIWDNWLTLTVLILVYSVDVGIRRLMGLT